MLGSSWLQHQLQMMMQQLSPQQPQPMGNQPAPAAKTPTPLERTYRPPTSETQGQVSESSSPALPMTQQRLLLTAPSAAIQAQEREQTIGSASSAQTEAASPHGSFEGSEFLGP
jgi:hypothetical protein